MPKFVIRWHRETAVGPIRESDEPNKRTQDGKKQPFLCSECEDRFEKYETAFARQVFHPAHNPFATRSRFIRYDSSCLKFAVSVSWRALRSWSEEARFEEVLGPEKCQLACRALAVWRSFLLDEAHHPAQFEQHVLPLSPSEMRHPGQSPSFNRYALRALDQCFSHSSEIMFVYSKLGRLVIFGMLPPGHRVPGWRNTKLHVRKGDLYLRDAVVEIPLAIMEMINERADSASEVIRSVSPRQQSKIQDALNERLRTNPTGEMFEALVLDYELFGSAALSPSATETPGNA